MYFETLLWVDENVILVESTTLGFRGRSMQLYTVAG